MAGKTNKNISKEKGLNKVRSKTQSTVNLITKEDKEAKLYSSHRKLKLPKYKSFKLHKKIRSHQPKLPSGLSIFKKALSLVKENKKIFIGILIINLLLLFFLVNSSRNSLDISGLKEAFESTYSGQGAGFLSVATLFGVLISSGSGAQETVNAGASIYQSIIMVIISIATIWAVRQLLAKQKITIKDSFYKSMTPVIPFVLVLFVIGLQLIPMALGSWLYGRLIVDGIAVNALEIIISASLIFLLFILSSYMLISSLFAPFIVTLPNMTPFVALRSARQLVRYRRLIVLRKILFLPFVLLILAIIIMLPFLVYLPAVAEFVFFVISASGWILTIIYMYSLYRELLNE